MTLALAGCLLLQAAAPAPQTPPAPHPDPWAAVRFMVGEWAGRGAWEVYSRARLKRVRRP